MIRRVGQTTCQVPVQRSDQCLIVFGQDPWRHGLIQITAGRNGNRVLGILKGFTIEGLGIHGGR